MFLRFNDEGHPAVDPATRDQYQDVVRDLYKRMDDLVGRVMEQLQEKDILIVMSDHGFKSFRRGFNLNSWLYQNGYLCLKDNKSESGEYFQGVDWNNTRAYGVGLSGLYINEKGRETQGIVDPGNEKKRVKSEIIEKLSGFMDKEKGRVAINQVYDTDVVYKGPYTDDAPDLLIGYNEGYRASWDSVVGKVTKIVIEDNEKSWGGDHCMDPKVVPGVFFCDRAISIEKPHIQDIAPTVLKLYGIEQPGYMDGKPLIAPEG
jgi:predicted AlkP superfamily phosphohydrolase/phosphomutase